MAVKGNIFGPRSSSLFSVCKIERIWQLSNLIEPQLSSWHPGKKFLSNFVRPYRNMQMKLKVARFAPPGVNRATTGFFKNMGPYGAHSGIHYVSPKPMDKCYLNMEIICFGG